MATFSGSADDEQFLSKAVEASIRIGLILVLVAWCLLIVRPFIGPIMWGIIIAVAAHPAFRHLEGLLGGRRKLAAALFTLMALLLLITPTVKLTGTLLDGAQELSEELREGRLTIPPPPANVASWPIIGERLDRFWSQASDNLSSAARQIEPQLKAFGLWLVSTAAGTGLSVLKFVIAILIAGAFLARADSGRDVARAIGRRLAGDAGADFADLAGATVRSVAQGILGVAIIQSLLSGIGLLAVGVPAAGLWALLVLVLAVIQLPPLLVLGPIIFYVFSTASTITAVAFMIWSILVAVSDTFLKPLLLGRGVDTPMPIIFIGALGGFAVQGIIGLFVGAVVLAVGYKLFLVWLDESVAAPVGDPR